MTSQMSRRVGRIAAGCVAALLFAAPAFAQDAPKARAHQGPGHAASGWAEMDAFHEVLRNTWHPAARSNDLRPIRTTADTLAQRAAAWSGSAVPKACDTRKVKEAVARVASDTRLLVMAVRRDAPDAEVKAALKGVHDTFEVAERNCSAGEPQQHP